MNITCINDSELVSKLGALVNQERECTAAIVQYLSELDRRAYYRDLGFSSLFAFCTQRLKYSEGAAQRRIIAARCALRFPIVLDYLREAKLSLTTLCTVNEHLTEDNYLTLLNDCSGKSKAKVTETIATNMGKELPKTLPKRDTIRAVPAVAVKETKALALFEASRISATPVEEVPQYNISFQADQEFMELLEIAKGLSGHPGIKLVDLFKKVLTEHIERKQRAPKVLAKTETNSRYIPVAVKHEVRKRDSNQCSYVSPDGTRCSCKVNLQLDHIKPFRRGGGNSSGNIRLLCPAHNQLEAERVYGKHFMGQFQRAP